MNRGARSLAVAAVWVLAAGCAPDDAVVSPFDDPAALRQRLDGVAVLHLHARGAAARALAAPWGGTEWPDDVALDLLVLDATRAGSPVALRVRGVDADTVMESVVESGLLEPLDGPERRYRLAFGARDRGAGLARAWLGEDAARFEGEVRRFDLEPWDGGPGGVLLAPGVDLRSRIDALAEEARAALPERAEVGLVLDVQAALALVRPILDRYEAVGNAFAAGFDEGRGGPFGEFAGLLTDFVAHLETYDTLRFIGDAGGAGEVDLHSRGEEPPLGLTPPPGDTLPRPGVDEFRTWFAFGVSEEAGRAMLERWSWVSSLARWSSGDDEATPRAAPFAGPPGTLGRRGMFVAGDSSMRMALEIASDLPAEERDALLAGLSAATGPARAEWFPSADGRWLGCGGPVPEFLEVATAPGEVLIGAIRTAPDREWRVDVRLEGNRLIARWRLAE